MYLNRFDESKAEVDSATELVAHQTKDLLLFIGKNASTFPHPEHSYMKLLYNGIYVAKVVEGCNALSVIILFVAFVIAFKGTLKHTLLFIGTGILIIHLLNIIRIALLVMALHNYPQHQHLLHGVIFPLFIYGVVFGLWVIWVQKFSSYAKVS
jgi:exosortase family protein XrtF